MSIGLLSRSWRTRWMLLTSRRSSTVTRPRRARSLSGSLGVASDLLASLKPWSIEDIFIVDRVYRVPPLPAIDWLTILLDDEVSLFAITGLLEPDANEDITEHVIAGRYSREDWEQLTWDLVSIAAGRPWWTTLYLVGNAKHPSSVEVVKGKLALHGVDATKISLSAWLDA